MASDISVGIGVLGEQEFQKALDECQNSLKQIDSGLKATTAEFGKNDDAIKDNAESLKLLQKGYDENKKIVDVLGEAIEWSKKEYGEFSKETTKYVVAQNKAREGAARFAKELQDADRNMTDLGKDAARVGRQLEQGIGEAADDTARKFAKMVNQMDSDLDAIKEAVEISALSDLGEILAGGVDVVVNAVSGLTEGTLDYRRQMAILEQNAKDMGFDPDWLKQQAANIAVLTGDMDGAVEAVSNLARVAPDVDSFRLVMDRLLGATIAWPDTFKIENLAESLQESLAGGTITGAYSELMTRLGMDVDLINKTIEEAMKAGGESAAWTAGTAWTSEHGFEKTIEQFREANAELLAYNQAKIDLTNAEAALAEKLTPAATAGIEMFTGMIDSITNLITAYDTWNTEFLAKNEETKKIVEETTKEAEKFTTLEEFNEAIAQADTEGAYMRANVLAAERDKFLKEQLRKTAEELDKQSKEDAEQIGKDISTSVGDGITEKEDDAANAATRLWNSIKAILSRTITIPAPEIESGGTKTNAQNTSTRDATYSGTTATTASATLTLDGKTVGEGMVAYNSSAMGAAVDRQIIYG